MHPGNTRSIQASSTMWLV